MRPTGPEVSDVFRAVQSDLPKLHLSPDKHRIFKAIVSCRTSALGGHFDQCGDCGHNEQSYNSCLNRHCPKCRGGDVFSWVNNRLGDLLPVPYFHVVFTLPPEFRELVYANKSRLYDTLFESSSETLLDVAKNNLSLALGFFGVLHTWNQELQFHPHMHYLVPGGGLHITTNQWENLPGKDKFFLPVRILGEVFRGKFIARLKELYRKQKLYIPEKLSHLNNPREFEHFVSRCAARRWVVYAKRPFAGPERVVKYLAGYTHRVGISNSRIKSVGADVVTFLARDRENPSRRKPVTLSHETFVRRFLQHGLPKGFRRIRYFGFLAVHRKREALTKIHRQLGSSLTVPVPHTALRRKCSKCGSSNISVVANTRKPHSQPLQSWQFREMVSLERPASPSP
jgi:hypothetical protein